jgi:hypothetical protein
MSEAKTGRPPTLTDAQMDELLQRITDGDSLLCIINSDQEWPSYSTIFRRIETDSEFRERYDRARAVQAERWADELVTLSDSLPVPKDGGRTENFPRDNSGVFRGGKLAEMGAT